MESQLGKFIRRPNLTKCGFGTWKCCPFLMFAGLDNQFRCVKGTLLQRDIEAIMKVRGISSRPCPGQGGQLN